MASETLFECAICEKFFVPYQLILMGENLVCGVCQKEVEAFGKNWSEGLIEIQCKRHFGDSNFDSE